MQLNEQAWLVPDRGEIPNRNHETIDRQEWREFEEHQELCHKKAVRVAWAERGRKVSICLGKPEHELTLFELLYTQTEI